MSNFAFENEACIQYKSGGFRQASTPPLQGWACATCTWSARARAHEEQDKC